MELVLVGRPGPYIYVPQKTCSTPSSLQKAQCSSLEAQVVCITGGPTLPFFIIYFLILSYHTCLTVQFQETKPQVALSWQAHVQELAFAPFLYAKAFSSLHGEIWCCWCTTSKDSVRNPRQASNVAPWPVPLGKASCWVELRKRTSVVTLAVTQGCGLVCRPPKSEEGLWLNLIGFRLHLCGVTPRTWVTSRISYGPRQ